MQSSSAAPAADPGQPSGLSSHPRGLMILFFTEMWERFSYYGMRALLVLFLVATVEQGGFGLSDVTATAIYGLYTAAVYMVGLPGGWIADRIMGQRQAVFVGGSIIAMGHFSMALGSVFTFYFGLFLIVVGTGLLKPNVSAIVADLYPEGGARRDAGFSIFYMGINVGAFAGPIICGYLGERVNWHLGFAAAGVGMVAGLIQYRLGWKRMGDAGMLRETDPVSRAGAIRGLLIGLGITVAILAVLVYLGTSGIMPVTPTGLATGLGIFIPSIAIVYFGMQLFFGGFNTAEKKRIVVIMVLFVACAVFWAGFEQAGSSMNLFAERLTDRTFFGWEMPTSWLQSINSIFIIALAPLFGLLWVRLGSREPSIPAKFAYGLLQLGAGFLILMWASTYIGDPDHPNKVSTGWLTMTYLLHTTGELCLSPVGLSAMTKLAPHRLVGQMMGIWFLATSLGNLMAGLLAGRMESMGLVELFGSVAAGAIGVGFLMLIITPPVKKLIGGVK